MTLNHSFNGTLLLIIRQSDVTISISRTLFLECAAKKRFNFYILDS